jgi:Replication-relaxation
MVAALEGNGSRRATSMRFDRLTSSLSPLDLRLLQIVSQHRVITQTQLELLLDDVPARTLRYRTRRLYRLGLVGRARPYRDRRSAPHHLWPTRAGDALARGGPAPRGGERCKPKPTFIAHAAALTGFYVALATSLPADVDLVSFAREAAAREPFRSLAGRSRAIAPDARVELKDEDGRRLVALLEVDLGTMSRRRLRAKARGYADYDRVAAWREHHEFWPMLAFATVAEPRALAFLAALEDELERSSELRACACALVREPARAVSEPVWDLLGGSGRIDLVAALREARRPYDEEQTRLEERRRREQAERERLRRDPEALQAHLRNERRGLPARLGEPWRTAVELLLVSDGRLAVPERDALSALARMLADPLLARWAEREPSARERDALAGLAAHYRGRQLEEVDRLARRLGDGPALRRARRRLASEELVSARDLEWLARDAVRDRETRQSQERLRTAYLERREREARGLAGALGLAARLRSRREDLLAEVDQRLLRVCPACEEVAYPGSEEGRPYGAARTCPFCGRGGLERLGELRQPGLGEKRASA